MNIHDRYAHYTVSTSVLVMSKLEQCSPNGLSRTQLTTNIHNTPFNNNNLQYPRKLGQNGKSVAPRLRKSDTLAPMA